MDFLTITLLIIVAYSIYHYYKKKFSYFEELGIPYRPGYPVFGSFLASTLKRKHINEECEDVYNVNKEAKYVGAFDSARPVYIIRDLELMKNITIKHFESFPDHRHFFDATLDPLFAGNLFSMTGESWKEARNLLSPAFTSSKMKAMHGLMVEVAKNFVNHMRNLKDEDRKMIDTKDLFTKFTNDVIASCAFGISIDSLKDPTNDFYVLGKEATNLDGMTLKFILASSCPILMKIFNLSFISKRVTDFFTNIVSQTVNTRDEKGISRPDMIQLMMDARGKESKHLKLDTMEMTAQAFIFFFGGFDSTSTQMCLIAHELAINPDIQRRLQEEIDEALSHGEPSYETINNMPYLDAVFNESMRLHTQNNISDRVCKKPFELPPALPEGRPITLQPGDNVWILGAAIHRDPQYYENPEKFDPERYLKKKVTINDVTNLGFGIGPRGCIGNRFAILETKVLFFHLLAEFNLVANLKTCSPLKYNKSFFTIRAEGGFWLAIEPRNRQH